MTHLTTRSTQNELYYNADATADANIFDANVPRIEKDEGADKPESLQPLPQHGGSSTIYSDESRTTHARRHAIRRDAPCGVKH